MNKSLKELVGKIEKLPTLPMIAQEILGIVGDSLITVDKLEKIIENDPAISAKILSVANSAFFGFKASTSTLANAIMRIGFANVKNIALGISLMTVIGEGKHGKTMDYQRVFNHSVSVGFFSRQFARELKLDIAEEMLISGMLHDIGYLVLNRYFPEYYRDVLTEFDSGQPLLDAEIKVFEFNHSDVGSWLSEQWNLPSNIQDSILYHHCPSKAVRHLKPVAIIHIADYIISRGILGPTKKDPRYPFDAASLKILGLSEEDMLEIENKISVDSFSADSFS
ncbi:HDOD domain-containing protein [bacterium]|nr:HDOD domain-containing protein [bacterium]